MDKPDAAEALQTLCAKLLSAMKAQGLTLSGAESLTGGLVAASLVSVPGASAVFKGSLVTYCDTCKAAWLSVPEEVLEADGAISAACAKSMAEGARAAAKADIAYATTGNAGPDAQEGKPVGLVYVAAANKEKTMVRELRLAGGREEIRLAAARSALMLCEACIKE